MAEECKIELQKLLEADTFYIYTEHITNAEGTKTHQE